MDNNFKLADWLVEPNLGTISNSQASIKLEPKAMTLLVILAEANGELVSREKLLSAVWPNQFVTDHTLNTLISSLRKNLNTSGSHANLIETRAKLGYRLSQPVTWLHPETHHEPAKSAISSRSTKKTGLTFALIILIGAGLWFTFANVDHEEKENNPSIANPSSATNSNKNITSSDYQVIRYLVKITLSYSKSELDSNGKALCQNYSYEILSKAIYQDNKWLLSNEYLTIKLKHKSPLLVNFEENYQVEYLHVLGKERDTMTIIFDAKGGFNGSGEMKVFDHQNKIICIGRSLYIGTKI